jgi:hypothetical protein
MRIAEVNTLVPSTSPESPPVVNFRCRPSSSVPLSLPNGPYGQSCGRAGEAERAAPVDWAAEAEHVTSIARPCWVTGRPS